MRLEANQHTLVRTRTTRRESEDESTNTADIQFTMILQGHRTVLALSRGTNNEIHLLASEHDG